MGADEDDAIEYVKALLSYLPSNNMEDPPVFGGENDLEVTDEDRVLDTIIPDSPNVPYDMHTVIEKVLDDEEFLEVQPLERLVFTWGEAGGLVDAAPIITLTFISEGERTELIFHLRGYAGEPGDGFVYDGWAEALPNVGKHLAGEPL